MAGRRVVAFIVLLLALPALAADLPAPPSETHLVATNPCPGLRINEFLPKPYCVDWDRDGTVRANDEWIELYNAGPDPCTLTGWAIDDRDGESSPYALSGTLGVGSYRVLYGQDTHIDLNDFSDYVRLLSPTLGVVQWWRYPNSSPDGSWSYVSGTFSDRMTPSPGRENGSVSERATCLPPSATPTPAVTATPTATATPTRRATAMATASRTPNAPTATPTPSGAATPSATPTSTPMGHKFEDLDANGALDPGEPLLGGWTVRICDMVGQLVYETTTVSDTARLDHGCWYLTATLPAGLYYVEEEARPGWLQTCPGAPLGRYLLDRRAGPSYALLEPVAADSARLDFGNARVSPTPTATPPWRLSLPVLLVYDPLRPTATPAGTATPTPTPTATPTLTPVCIYVGNSSSLKFHYPTCPYAALIAPQHRVCFASREEALAAGYEPCRVCNP